MSEVYTHHLTSDLLHSDPEIPRSYVNVCRGKSVRQAEIMQDVSARSLDDVNILLKS